MERAVPLRTAPTFARATQFCAIGLLIYLSLLAGAEWLVHRNGHMNPIFKIGQAAGEYDWLILGASHAMPLDYDGFNAELEAATGQHVLNLAGPGTGPLYNRFALEVFLRERKAHAVLYVVDSFAFRSTQWNEERLADPKLLARTPFDPAAAGRLAAYVWSQGVDPRALLDYVTGFSRLNNRDRFKRDVFEGEAQFDRVFRPSATADAKRVEYLYPPVENEQAALDRYLATLAALVNSARASGAAVVLARFPVPPRFKALLPDEAGFDAELERFAAANGLPLHDFSAVVEGREFFADTDHLNRAGMRLLVDRRLRALMTGEPKPVSPSHQTPD